MYNLLSVVLHAGSMQLISKFRNLHSRDFAVQVTTDKVCWCFHTDTNASEGCFHFFPWWNIILFNLFGTLQVKGIHFKKNFSFRKTFLWPDWCEVNHVFKLENCACFNIHNTSVAQAVSGFLSFPACFVYQSYQTCLL